MKNLKSIEFTETQMDELEIKAKEKGITVSELIERYTRKALNNVSQRKPISADVVTFKSLKSA